MAKKEYREGSFKEEGPRKDILRLDDQEGVRKNRKIIPLGKNDLIASPALREGRILGGKLRSIKKFPKNS
jgi:hypothetical protein